MQYSSVVQVLKVHDPREGIGKTGKPWKIQEAECILLDGDGAVAQVGVLDVPRDLVGLIAPGNYTASYSMRAHWQTRKIGPELVALTRIPPAAERAAKA